MSCVLRLQGVVKGFRQGLFRRAIAHQAVDGVDLSLDLGEVLGLVGESGAGKSTLARVAAGLLEPDRGSVEVLGQQWRQLGGRERRRLRTRVQMLFQSPDAHLNPELDVHSLLMESARLHRPEREPRALVTEALGQVGLSQRSNARPHELSGGEKRRVGIARILMAEPELIIADEPTAGLDAALKGDILDLIVESGGRSRGLLLISHDLPMVVGYSTRIAVMLGGRVIEEFPTERLGAGPHHPYTQALFAAAGLVDASSSPSKPASRPERGCPYQQACAMVIPACRKDPVPLSAVSADHHIACLALEVSP